MYIQNGIAYAGEIKQPIVLNGVRPLSNHRLWVSFNTGEVKIFDFTPLLTFPAYSPLKNEDVFRNVYIDYGVPVWHDGEIDIAPEYLYTHGTPEQQCVTLDV